MPIITFTSDTNYNDFYVARLKGKLLKNIANDLQLVDINHQIKRDNYSQAAFVMKHAIFEFPPNTIHICTVAAVHNNKLLLSKIDNQFLICNDIGMINLIAGSKIVECRLVELLYDDELEDSIVNVLKEFVVDFDLNKVGQLFEDYDAKTFQSPFIQGDFLKGSVIYIDCYENVITDIRKDMFLELVENKSFVIRLDPRISMKTDYFEDKNVYSLSTKFSEESKSGTIAYFNQDDLLEISYVNGNAAGLLGLKERSQIRIEITE
ncbi:MAG: SAM-dependent chlorinase/fluorinase [Cyclobacteriaceae bacterium]|nr:SAM-dependent chlorinase/fluorinase [Cyclobacteriaceae bacterium]